MSRIIRICRIRAIWARREALDAAAGPLQVREDLNVYRKTQLAVFQGP